MEEYEIAIGIDPKFADAYSNMGLVYCQKEMFDEAITILKKAIEINPSLPDAHNNLGFAYWKKGLKKKAMREVTIYKGLMGAK
jgi:tetratricopeptide (TPR) repeat protein